MRLERLAVDYVHGLREQARDVILHAHIVEHGHMGRGVKLDQDVDVAVRPVVAAGRRAEQRGAQVTVTMHLFGGYGGYGHSALIAMARTAPCDGIEWADDEVVGTSTPTVTPWLGPFGNPE